MAYYPGTTDPVSLAARFGRIAVAGTTVQSFEVYGLARDDNGKADGTIRVVRGVRYVQVARTPQPPEPKWRYSDADVSG